MVLTTMQLAFVSIAASVLVIVLRFVYEIAKQRSFDVPDWVMLGLVYLASLGLAILWFPQSLPALPVFPPEPLGMIGAALMFAGQLLTVLTAYAAAAAFIYDVLLVKVKDALGQLLVRRVYNSL